MLLNYSRFIGEKEAPASVRANFFRNFQLDSFGGRTRDSEGQLVYHFWIWPEIPVCPACSCRYDFEVSGALKKHPKNTHSHVEGHEVRIELHSAVPKPKAHRN